jgi:parvulin-like peptidyl-prolyl isomerase
LVLTKTQAQANAALKALKSGQSWTAVAKKYSVDPTTKNSGGVIKNVTKGQQDAALDSAAFSAPVNKIGGPVKGQFGYYVYEVTGIKQPTQQSLVQATPQIRQTLTSQRQTNAQTAIDTKAKKDWLSQTTCRSDYAMADCKGYKAPKTATTGASTTPAG